MSRLGIGAAAAAALALCACGPEPPRPPNVVIIALDTLRPDHLGCYGYRRPTSPNLDRFAARSALFENAQSAAPWTAPSLLSLMTSLYPSVHGVTSFPDPGRMHERVTTLAEVLKRRGYATAAFTDGGYAKPQFGLKQGFDEYPLNEGDTPAHHASNLDHPDRLRGNVERTLAWLDRRGERPFLLFFHTYQVHGPYRAPESFIRRFRPGYDEAAEHARIDAAVAALLDGRDVSAEDVRLVLAHVEHCGAGKGEEKEELAAAMRKHGVGSLEPERMQFWRDLYDAEIAYTDEELQRLFSRLDRPELANTLVVLVSDHGEGFGEHGVTGHGNVLHEEGLRVLLALRAPGVAPRRVADVVRTVDVMPTLLELAGFGGDHSLLQGRSLAPLLRGEPLEPAPSFSHALSREGHEARAWSVREGPWRYVWDEEARRGQLFDLAADPGALADVAAANPKVAERLHALLRSQIDVDAAFRERASGPVHRDYELDEATRKELARLGYLGDERDAKPPPKKAEDPR